jgi:8-oxo-dGTP diphosphatase
MRMSRYQIIPRVLCFVRSGSQVLLLKGAPDKKFWPGKYNALGGHVERGETVHAAAEREIGEEAGVQVADLRLRGVITVDDAPATEGEAGIGLFIFTAQALTRELTASAEGVPEWVSPSQFSSLDTVEDLPVLFGHLETLPLDAPPFGAHYHFDSNGRLAIEFYLAGKHD